MTRQTTRGELPPTPGNDWKQWAEQLIDYLQRQNTELQNQIDDHEARIEALEP